MPWLMKAEPDSRIVKGKDVKFSVDDFEEIGVSPWDGVRNHEAKKIMKEKMKKGQNVLFYHSNCKAPGVFALAQIDKEGYPDYTSWDPKHPYYDAKSSEESPTWYMVNVKFNQRLAHPPTLALIKHLASLSDLPEDVSYIGSQGLKAIKDMALVNRGRLSVQPVEDDAYEAIVKLGTQGGWEDLLGPKTKKEKTKNEPASKPAKSKAVQVKEKPKDTANRAKGQAKISKKRESAEKEVTEPLDGRRRSKRVKSQ